MHNEAPRSFFSAAATRVTRMADNFVLVAYFKGPDGSERVKLVERLNFGGKLSVLLEQMPALLRDVFRTPTRPNLQLRALWLGQDQWATSPQAGGRSSI